MLFGFEKISNQMKMAEAFKCILTVVISDDVQAVEQLSLVFMDSLDLNVKHGVGVDLHLVVLFQVHSEFHFVFLRDQNIYFTPKKENKS